MRIQFIVKKNTCYGFETYTRRSAGLFNSTRFIVEALAERGVHAEIIEVSDNNCIDRNLARFKPDICVIEALWVVPEKFDVLQRLHPRVNFWVHLHSNMPFLALEGMSMGWIYAYAQRGIRLISNSVESYKALLPLVGEESMVHLQNVYRSEALPPVRHGEKDHIDVGCFGAVRPMKNHLLQALAAIKFARERNKKLRFHINSSRVETGGQPVLKNLVELFDVTRGTELVKSKWNEPEEFIDYLHSTIDIGMQVSLTETFNVVSADYVTAGVPVVASPEVRWLSSFNHADPHDIDDIVQKMGRVMDGWALVKWNQTLLKWHERESGEAWYHWVKAQDYCGGSFR